MRAPSLFFVSLSLWVFTFASCDNKSASTSPAPAPVAKAKAGPVIMNEAQRQALTTKAAGWAASVSEGEVEDMLKDFDVEALFKGVVSELGADPDIRRGIEIGARRAVTQMRKTLADNWKGQAKFLRVLDTTDGTVARIRIVLESGGCSYLDLIPAVAPNGDITIRDVNNLTMGSSMGDSIKQVLSIMLAAEPKQQGLLAKLLGEKNPSDAEAKQILAYTQEVQNNKKRAVELYPKLPLGVRKNRAFFATYLTAAMALNDESVYMAAMEEGVKQFPKDPSLTFMMVDFHYLKKDFDAAEKCAVSTMAGLGEDGNLWHLIASIRREGGKFDAADEAYKKGIELEPGVMAHHMPGIQVSAQRKDYKEMVNRLNAANKALNDSMILMPIGEAYFDEALKSEEYEAYAAQLPK